MYIVLAGAAALQIFAIQKNARMQKIYWCVLFAALLFLYGCRGVSVGWDNVNYKKTFETQDFVQQGYFGYYMEAGYLLFNRIIYNMTHSYICFQFSAGLLILACHIKFIKSFAADSRTAVFLWLTLGVYFNAMNQIRQNLAVAAGLAAYMCLERGKKVWAVFLLAVGFFFHKGIVVYVPFFIFVVLCQHKVRRVQLYSVLFITAGAVFAVAGNGIRQFLSFMPLAGSYLSKFAEFGYLRNGNYSYPIFFTFLLLTGCYGYYVSDLETKKRNIAFLLGTVLAAFFAYLSIPINMMQRCMSFFAPFQAVFVANMISNENMWVKNQKILKLVMCACMLIFCYFYLKIAENGYGRDGVVPYVFFWQES